MICPSQTPEQNLQYLERSRAWNADIAAGTVGTPMTLLMGGEAVAEMRLEGTANLEGAVWFG